MRRTSPDFFGVVCFSVISHSFAGARSGQDRACYAGTADLRRDFVKKNGPRPSGRRPSSHICTFYFAAFFFAALRFITLLASFTASVILV